VRGQNGGLPLTLTDALTTGGSTAVLPVIGNFIDFCEKIVEIIKKF